MSSGPNLYLICYDISDDRRLRRVYKLMRGHGDRLQYSVFRCLLSDLRLADLSDKLAREIDHHEDQVLIIKLGSAALAKAWEMETLGRPLSSPERVVKVF